MISDVDGAHIAAEIHLIRQVHKGSILIVEGETDSKVMDRFISGAECQIEIAFGKKNVLDALDRLEDEGFAGVLAIVDADFDRIIGTDYKLSNLHLTDAHDFDLTIFSSRALGTLLHEYADREILKANFSSDVNLVRRIVIQAALPLSYCRFCSVKRGLRLYFKELAHDEYISADNLSTDENKLHNYLVARSSTSCGVSSLARFVVGDASRGWDPFQLANGHDVAAILGIALRKMLGSRLNVQTWASEIEAALRLSFDWEAFAETALYRSLRSWESENVPYRIFRDIKF